VGELTFKAMDDSINRPMEKWFPAMSVGMGELKSTYKVECKYLVGEHTH
jgi:hypothetical protein